MLGAPWLAADGYLPGRVAARRCRRKGREVGNENCRPAAFRAAASGDQLGERAPSGRFRVAASANRANAGSDLEPVFFMIEAR
jgi:hypothetical protein